MGWTGENEGRREFFSASERSIYLPMFLYWRKTGVGAIGWL